VGQTERCEAQQCCIGVVCHSRRRVATDHALTAGNLPRRANTFARVPLLHRQNPLSWCATNRQKYPSVAAVARRLLAVPAVSVASDRLFSKAGNVITKNKIVSLWQRFTL